MNTTAEEATVSPQVLLAHHLKSLKLLTFAREYKKVALRGLSGARDEFTLAAIAQELRRLARLTMTPRLLGGIVAPVGYEIR